MAKLEILTPAEQIIFNSPPNFFPDEQKKYFCLPPELAVWLKSVDSITNKAGFILLFGYCRAKESKKSCIQFDTRNVIGYNLSVCKAEFS
ncbi:MAG: hypothetical protein H0U75_04940 [Legionella sp.]|nr:hypothetical protein [Legionella sp.]